MDSARTDRFGEAFMTVDELAAKLKWHRGSVYNKISRGEWGREDGVYHFGARCVRIDWNIFSKRNEDGTLGTRGGSKAA